MANINIKNITESDLNGNNLFADSESFIIEIDDNGEQENIMGGLKLAFTTHSSPYCNNIAINRIAQ